MASLLIARNHLAGYYGNRRGHMSIPGLLKDKATCRHCPYAPECMLIHRSTEEGTATTSGVPDVFDSHTLHLSQSYLRFFAHWYGLVKEEHVHCRETESPPVWMSVAMEREKEGRCLADVMAKLATVGGRGKKFQSFVKRGKSSGASCCTVALSLSDRVMVSYQDGSRWAVAMGIVTMVTSPAEVQLCIDKPVPCNDVVYRLDVVDSNVSSSVPLSNLTKVCLSDSERDCRLRELVIDLIAPRFTHQHIDEATPTLATLNDSQRLAVSQVLRCHDYSLILGMPGTGKTSTIACLVQALVARGNTILLTSYTHSAVDNILLKLKEAGVDFVRLGSAARIHPDIFPFTPTESLQGVTSVKQLEDFYQSKAVVATTCLGINHPLFLQRSFDYCILDEATQITLPVNLGPLRHASQFVLVGDHYQLPPLVQSEGGRAGGLDVSLFRRLTEHHPQAMVTLEYQYRMNSDIMSLSNSLIYNNRLKCGSEGVALSRLHVPQLHQLYEEAWQSGETWVWRAVDPDQPVVFLNTDTHPDRRESHSGDHIHNLLEVQMVLKVIDVFTKGRVPPSSIGVITPYRYQQRLISEALQSCGGVKGEGLEVNTVDRYQGRDKDCIVVSLVRCNDNKNVGRLLLDWRRVNVALTRARHKLILIGSLATLQSSPVLQCLGALLRQKQWVEAVGPPVHDAL